ncbi:MAG: hypothetical protein KTR31_39705 [Myxococcales bacterium]|nr:hypothetical protein [Myxococcales bacterium]
MAEHTVQWQPDGVVVRFAMRGLPFVVRPELWLLYALLTGGVAVVGAPLLATLMAPPGVLAWLASRRYAAEIRVDHQRVEVRGPLGRRIRVDLRDVREVDVYDEGLELLLWGGRRVRVPAPAPGRDLSFVVDKIRLLRDETQQFALEMAERREEAQGVKRLLGPR